MKQWILTVCVALTVLLTGGCTAFTGYDEEKDVLYWVPEESNFVQYEIVDEKIRFSYSICFVNDSEEAQTISLSAKFNSNELEGWIKNSGFFLGNNEQGELLKEEISPGTKENITFYFEGDYLGGTVNNELSFPCEIILMN